MGELQCRSLWLWAHFPAFRPNPEAVLWLSGFQALKLYPYPSSKNLVGRETSHSSQHGSYQSLSASVSHIRIPAAIFSYPETTNNNYLILIKLPSGFLLPAPAKPARTALSLSVLGHLSSNSGSAHLPVLSALGLN